MVTSAVRVTASGRSEFAQRYKAQSLGVVHLLLKEGSKKTLEGSVERLSEVFGHLIRDDEENQMRVLVHSGFIREGERVWHEEDSKWLPIGGRASYDTWEILAIPRSVIAEGSRMERVGSLAYVVTGELKEAA